MPEITAPDDESLAEKQTRDLMDRGLTDLARIQEEYAMRQVAIRRGQLIPRYRKLLLVDGRPADTTPAA